MRCIHRLPALLALALLAAVAWGDDVPDIGSHREWFVDHVLVGELRNTSLKLHEPQAVAPVSPPRPRGHYATVLGDDGKLRIYHRGDRDTKVTWKTHGIAVYHDGEVTLDAESDDGIPWTLPRRGGFDHPSFPAGNIVLMDEFLVNHSFPPSSTRSPACRRPSLHAATRRLRLGERPARRRRVHHLIREFFARHPLRRPPARFRHRIPALPRGRVSAARQARIGRTTRPSRSVSR